MAQPIRNKKIKPTKASHKPQQRRKHKQEYGTSKLEERFAKDFLDANNIKYQYQYKAEEIGRYYDFMLTTDKGSKILLEIDGDFYHGYGKEWDDKNPMQKHNQIVDGIKNDWALLHGIPLIRIWEHDVNNNPEKVRKILNEAIGKVNKKTDISNNKKKRH